MSLPEEMIPVFNPKFTFTVDRPDINVTFDSWSEMLENVVELDDVKKKLYAIWEELDSTAGYEHPLDKVFVDEVIEDVFFDLDYKLIKRVV